MRLRIIPLFIALAVGSALAAPPQIGDVSVVPRSFSPALRQQATLSFSTKVKSAITVTVIDRDGVPVRVLASHVAMPAGRQAIRWDGRDEQGTIVPDEAWSFKIDLQAQHGNETYFPAAAVPRSLEVSGITYDRSNRIIRYVLPFAARVHVQAGTATIGRAGRADGPVLKTIVDRQPRVAGSILEQWSGMDESGSSYVPDLKDFVIGIAAAALPENSVITTGNRSRTFIDSIGAQRRVSLLPPHTGSHAHHAGLTATEDVSPKLAIEWSNDDEHRGRRALTDLMHLTIRLDGPSTPSFLTDAASVQLFVDGVRVGESPGTTNPMHVAVSINRLAPGAHHLAVNWATAAGPVAVNTMTFETVRTNETSR